MKLNLFLIVRGCDNSKKKKREKAVVQTKVDTILETEIIFGKFHPYS